LTTDDSRGSISGKYDATDEVVPKLYLQGRSLTRL
jgi:hypothetical protein